MPNVAAWSAGHAKSVKLKMQAAWPSGANIFFEMAGDYCKMVKEMSGGSLSIDLQPVGAVVKTKEIGQAVSSGVVDMGHWVTAYCVVKIQRLLFLERVLHTECHLKLWHGLSMVEEENYMTKLLLKWDIIILVSFICLCQHSLLMVQEERDKSF